MSDAAPVQREFLTFKLGNESYAIEILKVQEIRGYEQPTRIANTPDFIKGVINLRGHIVPIVDLRLKLALGDARYDSNTVVIILNILRRVVGIVVDSVSDVITLEDAQMYNGEGSTTSVYTLSSTSFEFGTPLGLDLKIAGDLHLTAEVEYMRRIFNSLSTDPPTGFPSVFPRTLDLSGMSWSLGVQLSLPWAGGSAAAVTQ